MAEPEIARFLSNLAAESRVSGSTQNQALNALLFLYHQVLGKEIGYVNGVVRAKKAPRLPVVLTRGEIQALLGYLDGSEKIMATLLYGAGLRLMECCRLRVKDIDFSQNQIVVRAGKGDKDRYTMLPAAVKELPAHRDVQHDDDLCGCFESRGPRRSESSGPATENLKMRCRLWDRLRANSGIGRHAGSNCQKTGVDFRVASERYSSTSNLASRSELFGIGGQQRRGLNGSLNSSAPSLTVVQTTASHERAFP